MENTQSLTRRERIRGWVALDEWARMSRVERAMVEGNDWRRWRSRFVSRMAACAAAWEAMS